MSAGKPALGDRVQDQITKLTGIVVSTTDWLYGCRRLCVQPEDLDKDGKLRETAHFDEAQLVVVQRGVIEPTVQPVAAPTSGGPPRGEEERR